MSKLVLNFYGVVVSVETEVQNIIDLLRKDFSRFTTLDKDLKPYFTIDIKDQQPPLEKVPQMVSSMQTLNSICYDNQNTRYCDYYGELLVIWNKEKSHADIFSKNIQKIHEVAYLLILSRIGKELDQKGLHKLHAFSVSYKDLAIVCMMPMKGGKSTLLMEFLKDSRFKIISDDIPLINIAGEVRPFPIKIGLSSKPGFHITNPEVNLYSMERAHYGKKELLCLEGIADKVEYKDKVFNKILLIEAFRYNAETSILKDAGFLTSFKGVGKHGIIGFGLPMVMEYFWESGLKDFFVKAKIFLLRCIGFTCLIFRAKCMKLFLGKRPKEAVNVITKYVIENYDRI